MSEGRKKELHKLAIARLLLRQIPAPYLLLSHSHERDIGVGTATVGLKES